MAIIAVVCALALSMFLAATGVTAETSPAATFYVATNGNDSWSGKLAAPNAAGTDGPFAGIAAAQKAVRAWLADNPGKPVTVLIAGGTYRLTGPIVFTPEDSGTEAAPVTYSALPGQTPVFSGGQAITGWRQGEGNLWVAEVPEVKAGGWYFHQLFVNGQRRTRARTPNEGYLQTAGPINALNRQAAMRDPATKRGFRYNAGTSRIGMTSRT